MARSGWRRPAGASMLSHHSRTLVPGASVQGCQRLLAGRGPAAGDRRAGRGDRCGATGSRPCSASPAAGRAPPSPGPSSRSSGPRWSSPPTSPWPPSWPTSSGSSSPRTGSSTSSPTTTTTSPRPTSRRATPTSRRTRSINDEIDRLRHTATSALLARRDVIVVASVSCIYGLGSPEEYAHPGPPPAAGRGVRPAGHPPPPRRHAVRAQRRQLRPWQVPGAGRHHRGASPPTRRWRIRIELFGDEVERISRVDPLTGEHLGDLKELDDLPGHPLRGRRGADEAGHGPDRGGAGRPPGLVREGGQAARGPAPPHAHPVRPGDDAGGRLLQRHRELLPPHRRPRPRRGPEHPARLLPQGLPARHRRVPRDGPPAPRPVRGRPLPQGDAGRPRVPPAVGRRQPPAAVRRVVRAGQPGRVPVGHAVGLRDRAVDPGRRADRAAHRPDRPRGHRQAHQGPDRRPHGADQRSGSRRATGSSSPPSPRRWPRTSPTTSSSWACGCATCTARSTPSSGSRSCATCGWASSTCWSASTCCGRASTCPRCRLVAILDADKEGFLRSETSLIQTIGRAARNVDGQVIMYADKVTDSMQRAHLGDQPPPGRAGGLQRRARHRPPDHPQGGHRHPGHPAARGRRQVADARARTGAPGGATGSGPTSPSCPATSWPGSSRRSRRR